MKRVLKEIDINKIVPHPGQPRTIFDEEKITELANSIKENGLIQPITVYKDFTKYIIVAGERRYRACKQLGLKTVPCIITKRTEKEFDILAIIENIQRENLSVIEEAKAMKKLLFNYGYTQSELATKLGKNQSTVANKLRLLNLSQPVQEALDNKQITERHARAMLKVEATKQPDVLQTIIEKNYNVQQTEDYLTPKEKTKKSKKVSYNNKMISKNVKIALNTINQSISLIEKTGIPIEQSRDESEEEIIITLRIKK